MVLESNDLSVDRAIQPDEICLTCAHWNIPVTQRHKCKEDTVADCSCIAFRRTKTDDTCALYVKHPKCQALVDKIIDEFERG